MRQRDLSPSRQRQLVACDPPYAHCKAIVPPATPRALPSSPKMSSAIREATLALDQLRADAGLQPHARLITRTLARREAVQSSQIEGTRTQLPELLEYEATHALDGAPADARVTERYVVALDRGMATLHDERGLDLDLVRQLHRTLMADAPVRVRPGEWRDTQAWIGTDRIEDATFVPPPPAYIDACMRELSSSMLRYEAREDEFWEIPLVARLALMHAQFETIHPFMDGNGRVGRLLMPLLLAAEGYPPLYLSGYLLRHRHAYYDALAAVQRRDEWDGWIAFLCRAIVDACGTSMAIVRDLQAIAVRWQATLADVRTDAAVQRVPGLLLGHPVTTIKELASLLGTTFQTASTAVDQLVARGILEAPAREVRRDRVFRAREILNRLERP